MNLLTIWTIQLLELSNYVNIVLIDIIDKWRMKK